MQRRKVIYRLSRIPHRLYWELRSWIFPLPTVFILWFRNRYSRFPLIEPGGVVVSLTSYGRRIETVYLAIESIGRGRSRPARLILWLDEQSAIDNAPATIRRLIVRGLEVRYCFNYGAHKKYYPYLQTVTRFEDPLVTADDDVLYTRDWLDELSSAYMTFPDVINCHRARVIKIEKERMGSYESWELVSTTLPTYRHMATGVAGVIYPPKFLIKLKEAGEAFQSVCPSADDLWLHAQAMRAGYPVRQVREKPLALLSIPGAEGSGLWKVNLFGGNDAQIAATYTPSELHSLSLLHEEEGQ